MNRHLATYLDRLVLRLLKPDCDYPAAEPDALERLHKAVASPSFFEPPTSSLPDLAISSDGRFELSSPVATPWPKNNTVRGRLFQAAEDWRRHPTIILLHGWNAEIGYRYHFPLLARKLTQRGMNVLTFELPLHGSRKPTTADAPRNFISPNLAATAEAVRQAVLEIRALNAWLKAQTVPSTGLLGFSLGGWLAGLTVCHDAHCDFAAMVTPVARLDRAIDELSFCKPLREPFQATAFSLGTLDLTQLTPMIPRERILIVSAQYDLITPPETQEELANAWQGIELWRVRQGHISIWLSPATLSSIGGWARCQCASPGSSVTAP